MGGAVFFNLPPIGNWEKHDVSFSASCLVHNNVFPFSSTLLCDHAFFLSNVVAWTTTYFCCSRVVERCRNFFFLSHVVGRQQHCFSFSQVGCTQHTFFYFSPLVQRSRFVFLSVMWFVERFFCFPVRWLRGNAPFLFWPGGQGNTFFFLRHVVERTKPFVCSQPGGLREKKGFCFSQPYGYGNSHFVSFRPGGWKEQKRVFSFRQVVAWTNLFQSCW